MLCALLRCSQTNWHELCCLASQVEQFSACIDYLLPVIVLFEGLQRRPVCAAASERSGKEQRSSVGYGREKLSPVWAERHRNLHTVTAAGSEGEVPPDPLTVSCLCFLLYSYYEYFQTSRPPSRRPVQIWCFFNCVIFPLPALEL